MVLSLAKHKIENMDASERANKRTACAQTKSYKQVSDTRNKVVLACCMFKGTCFMHYNNEKISNMGLEIDIKNEFWF